MKPIPVVFHLGPLQIHTYGIGLAITFWFAYRYFRRRLSTNGYPTAWLSTTFVWVIVASIVGARIVHVVANWHYYSSDPGQIPMVWHGGLSSFGGLAGGIAVGIWQLRKGCPELPVARALDLVAPVLMAAWAMGRLLGPLVMVNGGGHPCDSWYCVRFATGVTTPSGAMTYTPRELPVPVFQAAESFAVYLLLLRLERFLSHRRLRGVVVSDGMVIAGLFAFWGLARFFDEFFWLDVNPPPDAVEITGLVLSFGGFLAMGLLTRKARRRSGPVPAQAAADAASAEDTSE
jgi:phosphatidylglycerol:prolipoprotein diacylglycerol transferase